MNYLETYRGIVIYYRLWQDKIPEFIALGLRLSSIENIKERIDIELDSRLISIATEKQDYLMTKLHKTYFDGKEHKEAKKELNNTLQS